MSITSKYQVTVPKDVRDLLGLRQKDGLIFTINNDMVLVEKAPTIEDIQNRAQRLMKKRGVQHVTDEEMANARELFGEKKLKW